MTDQRSDRAGFADAVAGCRDCEFSVDWWTRGGEPGPGYTSDKLTVAAGKDAARATYIKTRFDPAFEGGFRALRFAGYVDRAEAERLLAAFDRDRLFDRRFAAEGRGDLADGVKDTIEVKLPSSTFAKTMVEIDDADLAEARKLRDALSARLEAAGRGEDLNERAR